MTTIWHYDESKIDSVTYTTEVVLNLRDFVIVTFGIAVVVIVSVGEEQTVVVTKGWIVTGSDWFVPREFGNCALKFLN